MSARRNPHDHHPFRPRRPPIGRQTSVFPQPTEADGRRDVGRRPRTRPSAGTFSSRSAESSCPLPGARRDNASSISPAGRVSPRSPERLDVGALGPPGGARWSTGRSVTPRAIPYASPSFDSVVSWLGVMFERHHQTVAKELLRMTTLCGRIGLLSGTPRASGPAGGPREPLRPDTADASAGPAASGTRSTGSRTHESSATSPGMATVRPARRTGSSQDAATASPSLTTRSSTSPATTRPAGASCSGSTSSLPPTGPGDRNAGATGAYASIACRLR